MDEKYRFQSMNCRECVLKHLALAISLGKEILDGHGKDKSPDHRPDFLGELVNAEHHMAIVMPDMLKELRGIRVDKIEKNEYTPTPFDLDLLRQMWVGLDAQFNLDVEREMRGDLPELETLGGPIELPESLGLDGLPVKGVRFPVLVDKACWNEEKLKTLRSLFARYASFYDGVYTSFDDIDTDTDGYIWYIPSNVYPINTIDLRNDFCNPVRGKSNWEQVMTFRNKDLAKFLELNKNASFSTKIDLLEPVVTVTESLRTRIVDIKERPCCSVTRKLQVSSFVRPLTKEAMDWVISRI